MGYCGRGDVWEGFRRFIDFLGFGLGRGVVFVERFLVSRVLRVRD